MNSGAREQLNDAMRALGQGHAEAMKQVFALTSPKIYGKLAALLKSPELAQHALTGTYLRLWKNHASIPASGCDYMHFIAAIAHQIAVDIRFSDTSDGELLHHVPNAPSDGAPHMDMSALEELSEADRDMLTAAYLHFESIEQIASRTGVPVADVRARLAEIARRKSGGAE
ncbi:RNA polymerase sigma factor [Henriciella algicola]|jgi:RNA polymerase sigma-70 factor, ECF subfamily|uniref:RNA polymerase sigma factor 70 region 4 type 2 domain-containing protein n=1 Tax=Henriciella algicola TaxID=1608422 RepID=A0A399RGJ6_9PROT|nr:sigma factor-like helix-turn-helix DNA-binding protein [Henriciella algicola]RIJ29584.1 hypothetical protein D1222_09325 [Henriciella algicola]